MKRITFTKTITLTLTILASWQSYATVPSLEDIVKRSHALTTMQQDIKAQAPELLELLTKDPNNEALLSLIYTIATSKTPVLVKFYSNYCAPCRAMAPIIETMSTEFKDKVSIIEVDTAVYRTMTTIFNFKYIPTLIFFKNGKEVERTNSLTHEQLHQKLEALV